MPYVWQRCGGGKGGAGVVGVVVKDKCWETNRYLADMTSLCHPRGAWGCTGIASIEIQARQKAPYVARGYIVLTL